MKTRTIKAVIAKKMKEWWETIDDAHVRKLVERNTIVTGGCIPSMLASDKIRDFDVYFRNKETVKAVAEYYLDKFLHRENSKGDIKMFVKEDTMGRVRIITQSAGIASDEGTDIPYQYFETVQNPAAAGEYVSELMGDEEGVIIEPGEIEDTYEKLEDAALENNDGTPKYRPVFLSSNAITLSHKVQVVIRFYGEPEEIHKNYDYVHCTNYWTSWGGELVLHKDALASLITKELQYTGSLYPLCSIFRARKFIRRGWTINAGQLLKMALQLNDMNLTNMEVLRDQLIGVDCAYFVEVLDKVKETDPDKINSAYLIEIIDRMF